MRLRLAFLAAIIASPALAAEPPAAEAPVATASASSSVADQIDAYLRSSPALETEAAEGVAGIVPGDDRKPHGEVSIGVGTHGYRSVYMRTDLPVGENGRLSIAIEDTRFNGGRHGRWGGRSMGANLAVGASSPTERQRCDLEGMTPVRPLDRVGGPNGRCVGSVFDR